MHDIIIYYCGKLSRIKGNKKVKKVTLFKSKTTKGKEEEQVRKGECEIGAVIFYILYRVFN
jgi:hypothetical protein